MKSVEFTSKGLEDLAWWIREDRRVALKITKILRELQRTPFHGAGKPEPLKHEFQGCWSRRITSEHRLVYEVEGERVRILACRYHYSR